MLYILAAISLLLRIIEYTIIARIILSWIPIARDNPLIRLLYQITEPILAPIRGLIERSSFGSNMMFDFSPVIAFLIIELIRGLIYRI